MLLKPRGYDDIVQVGRYANVLLQNFTNHIYYEFVLLHFIQKFFSEEKIHDSLPCLKRQPHLTLVPFPPSFLSPCAKALFSGCCSQQSVLFLYWCFCLFCKYKCAISGQNDVDTSSHKYYLPTTSQSRRWAYFPNFAKKLVIYCPTIRIPLVSENTHPPCSFRWLLFWFTLQGSLLQHIGFCKPSTSSFGS